MIRKLSATSIAATALAVLTGLPGAASAHPQRVVGHVYQATNDSGGNAVAVFDRYADGSLQPAGAVPTGGLGAGASLHSQGGVTRDGRLVFVVNAGDDSVSALAVTRGGLVLRDKIGSQGDFPVSVTVREGVGYVLNQASDTIAGFRYDRAGNLHALRGSTRALTANPTGGSTDAAQVSFTPNGRSLVVTEKASNTIDTFRVSHGYAGSATPHASAGTTPYGFDFDRRGHAIVSEAATGVCIVLPGAAVRDDHPRPAEHTACRVLAGRQWQPRVRGERGQHLHLYLRDRQRRLADPGGGCRGHHRRRPDRCRGVARRADPGGPSR